MNYMDFVKLLFCRNLEYKFLWTVIQPLVIKVKYDKFGSKGVAYIIMGYITNIVTIKSIC